MAGQLPSFLNGSLLVVRIGKMQLAYCQALSFNQNMNIVPVSGLGTAQYQALEPVQFGAGGTMRVVRWDKALLEKIAGGVDNIKKVAPANFGTTLPSRGNTVIDTNHFNPINLLCSVTFDIHVMLRTHKATNDIVDVEAQDGSKTKSIKFGTGESSYTPQYKLLDCRLTNYSYSFAPGSLLYEDISFVCQQVNEVNE